MYEIKVTKEFCGAHRLRNYKGKCEALHGHNWKVECSVFSERLGPEGMLIDFKDLKSALNAVIEEMDHSYLNEREFFKEHNPTSENIARFIHDKMRAKIKDHRIKVSVWETESSCASFVG